MSTYFMKGFDQIVTAILDGVISGSFRLRNNEIIPTEQVRLNTCPILGHDYPYIIGIADKTYTNTGIYYYGQTSPFDVVEFIKNPN